jgi:uncharacterized protein YchJ
MSETKDYTLLLVNPEVVKFIDFKGLVYLREVSKFIHGLIEKSPEDLGFWKSMCNSYCFYAGIYSHSTSAEVMRLDYRKFFFTELWNVRNKWNTDGSELSLSLAYKIKVANRFRPGEIKNEKVFLPLHQFLKVKRFQKSEDCSNKHSEGQLFVGERDPEEFVDPFLGTLMKDPVKLASSEKIVDRSVAVQCILRGGRDPFNGARLTMAMLEPQPLLNTRIQEFRARKQQWDVSVEVKDLKPLLANEGGEGPVDPDLLEALLDVDRLNLIMRRAQVDASDDTFDSSTLDQLNIAEDALVGIAEDPAPGPEFNDDILVATLEQHNVATGNEGNQSAQLGANFEEFDIESSFQSKKAERAGIVEIDTAGSTVCMHVPGVGVRPYHYAAVHAGTATQLEVYERSAQDAVCAVLNGHNSCVMCYGQTGTFLGSRTKIQVVLLIYFSLCT